MSKAAKAYRWSDMPTDQPMPEITRRRIIGEKGMLSHVTLEAGCFVPPHQHENEQFACVLHGKIKFTLGEGDDPQTVTLRDGETLHLPSNVVHSAEALEETVIIDVFVPPSEGTGIDRKS